MTFFTVLQVLGSHFPESMDKIHYTRFTQKNDALCSYYRDIKYYYGYIKKDHDEYPDNFIFSLKRKEKPFYSSYSLKSTFACDNMLDKSYKIYFIHNDNQLLKLMNKYSDNTIPDNGSDNDDETLYHLKTFVEKLI